MNLIKRIALYYLIGATMAKIEEVNTKLVSINELADALVAKLADATSAASAAATQTASDLDTVMVGLSATETKLSAAVNPPVAG